MPTPDRDVLTWLRKFEAACRGRNFDTGRLMFAQDAVAFGTWAMAIHRRDNIEREQWRNVWPRIRDFTLAPRPVVRSDGDTAWIADGWQSEAQTASPSLAPAAPPSSSRAGTGAGSACTATCPSSPPSPSRPTARSAPSWVRRARALARPAIRKSAVHGPAIDLGHLAY